jgi:tRNA dimethylallyltransferase
VAASRIAYALLGPTASGKSRLAMALAERVPLEIVSLDSAQVYRGMDIGTAKPTREERARVPHHLIDVVDPAESYSAGRFRAEALAAVNGVLSRGKIPLLVGGTMLYYRTLVSGLDALPAADPSIRKAIDAEAARRGWHAMHEELKRIDPAAAGRIDPNDSQRIQRALEVWRMSGRTISSFHGESKSALPFALKTFALVPADRAALHRRIAERFDAMLAAGLVDELRMLREKYPLTADMPSMRAVGYRQAWQFLENEIDRAALREKGVAATRQLAKRQLTWMRSFTEAEVLSSTSPDLLEARLKAAFRLSPR